MNTTSKPETPDDPSHGTLVGLERHTLLGTPVCDPCLNLACALEQDRTWGPINRLFAS